MPFSDLFTDSSAEQNKKLEKLRADLDALTEENKQLRQMIEELQAKAQQVAEPMPIEAEIAEPEPAPELEVKPEPEPKPVEKPDAAPEPKAVDLKPIIDHLDKIERMIDDNNYKDELVRKLHAEVQKGAQDQLAQLATPYARSIIKIHDRLADTLKNIADLTPEAVIKTIEATRVMVEDMLDDDYDIVYYAPAVGDPFEPRVHSALRSIPTDDPAKVSTIAECRQGGFRNQVTGKVIKPALVTVYKKQ